MVWPAALYLLGMALCSLAGVAILIRRAHRTAIFDIPNHRSSHQAPTPRGGGLALLIVFVLGLLSFVLVSGAYAAFIPALLCLPGLILIAMVSYLDDRRSIAARWRLLTQILAFSTVIILALEVSAVSISWWIVVLGLFFLISGVWIINLYNFMDGIDGIAGLEAITVAIAMAICAALCGQIGWMWFMTCLAAATAGFLWWNLPPAKIFMGDVGSASLGYLFASAWCLMSVSDVRFFWIVPILLGVFIVDASITLLRRLIRGVKVWEAHREHAYQYASRRYQSHGVVSYLVALINVLWLFPFALLVLMDYIYAPLALFVSYFPLVLVALFFGAGRAEQASTT